MKPEDIYAGILKSTRKAPIAVQRRAMALITWDHVDADARVTMIQGLCRLENLDEKIDEELGTLTDAKAVVAWLSRPGRPPEAVEALLAKEKRVSVLEALAENPEFAADALARIAVISRQEKVLKNVLEHRSVTAATKVAAAESLIDVISRRHNKKGPILRDIGKVLGVLNSDDVEGVIVRVNTKAADFVWAEMLRSEGRTISETIATRSLRRWYDVIDNVDLEWLTEQTHLHWLNTKWEMMHITLDELPVAARCRGMQDSELAGPTAEALKVVLRALPQSTQNYQRYQHAIEESIRLLTDPTVFAGIAANCTTFEHVLDAAKEIAAADGTFSSDAVDVAKHPMASPEIYWMVASKDDRVASCEVIIELALEDRVAYAADCLLYALENGHDVNNEDNIRKLCEVNREFFYAMRDRLVASESSRSARFLDDILMRARKLSADDRLDLRVSSLAEMLTLRTGAAGSRQGALQALTEILGDEDEARWQTFETLVSNDDRSLRLRDAIEISQML